MERGIWKPLESDEVQSLVAGEFPNSLTRPITAVHLNYVLAGEMQVVNLTIDGQRITGTAQSKSGERADLLGHLVVQNGRITRCDLLAKGIATHRGSHGFFAALEVLPKDARVPVALLLELANPTTPLGRVPPHRIFDPVYFR